MKHLPSILILVAILCSRALFAQPDTPIMRKVVERYAIPGTSDELEMILIE